MSRKPRTLSPEEERLWQRAAGGTRPLDKKRASKVVQELPKRPDRPDVKEAFKTSEFRVGERAAPSAAAMPDASQPPLRMDQKRFNRMRRGKTAPDSRIDLHGKTVAEGRAALESFLLDAYRDGNRTVLVITGKGREGGGAGPVPQRRGILRQQLPHWISGPPLDQIVLQCTEAHPRHGGSGAFYVYLARRR